MGTLSASYSGVTKTTTLTVNPPLAAALSSVTLNPAAVIGGTSAIGTVTLTAAAPAGGATVALASSNTTLAKVPASVVIPAGSTSANFTITTFSTRKTATVTITATYAGVSKAAALTVKRR